MSVIAAPRRYLEELRERATRMAVEARRRGLGLWARVAAQLGVNPETVRNLVTQAEVDTEDRPGTTSAEAARIAELERGDPRRGRPRHRRPHPHIHELNNNNIAHALAVAVPDQALKSGPSASPRLDANAATAYSGGRALAKPCKPTAPSSSTAPS